jgi:hypothetical protein
VAVPISDTYIIQYLVDGTREAPTAICWDEKPGEQTGYQALVEGVEVILEPLYSRGGSRWILRFRDSAGEFQLCEPASGGWLGRKFSTEDELSLVDLFRELMSAVSSQCAERQLQRERNREQVRERITRQLLFGQPDEPALPDAYRHRV